jgi:hypothetical protein
MKEFKSWTLAYLELAFLFVCLFVRVLGFELRAYTLSQSTSPFS